ncbi:MAG: hypothetical protein RDV48_06240 [Candidatus Eremiobacteraeota bacterium]|nr:hypothetical protein [Candidatus Eremiobacteraeota bacterium]
MDISENLSLRQMDYQAYIQAREARKTEALVKLQETAPVSQVKELTEAERALGVAYLNTSLSAVDKLNAPRYSHDMTGIFPFPYDDMLISFVTTPREQDNEEAQSVKSEYRELYQEIKKGLAFAQQLVKKLGPGTHTLTDKNGKPVATVTIAMDRGGNVNVDIARNDGTRETISYNTLHPGSCTIEKTGKDGTTETLDRDGTTVSRSKNGVTDRYSIDEFGRPVREKSGPGDDDYRKTVVNPDGSTDDYNLIYNDEEGNPIYEHTHKDPKGAKYQDEGAGKAIEALKAELAKNPHKKVSGEEMEKLIINATADFDGQAAGKEYDDLKKFVNSIMARLSPEAKAVWAIYEKHVQQARAKGQTGIDQQDYEQMKKEMKEAGNPYKDEGAGQAIEALKAELDKNPRRKVSGEEMEKLIINATADFDNQAAGKEYDDLKKFVNSIMARLSPEAKAVWAIYEKHVQQARAKGQTGIDQQDYEQMKKEMKEAGNPYKDEGAGQAIEALKAELDKNPRKKVSGEEMEKLIINATADFDGQAAGKEYDDLKKFVTQYGSRLSPDARAKWAVYEKYVEQARAKGQTGIDLQDYEKMIEEMNRTGYKDAGAGQAIEDLKAQNPSEISGDQVYHLIIRATQDPDNQAAGSEFDDLQKFVKENWSKLSPEGKAVWEVYEKYVEESRSMGQTGIDQERYQEMVKEMNEARQSRR